MTDLKVDPKPSFLNLVYPFLFDADSFGPLVEHVKQAAWVINDREVPVWGPRQTSQEDLLPHVANYLHQQDEEPGLAPPHADLGSAQLRRMNEVCRTSPQGLGCRDKHKWLLWLNDTSIPIHFRHIDLMLFSNGVGFLIFQIEVVSDRVEDWMNTQCSLRFTRGGRSRRLTAQRSTGPGQSTFFVPQPRNPKTPTPSQGTDPEQGFSMQTMLDLALGSAGLGTGGLPIRTAYLPGRFLPYLVLFVDGEESADSSASAKPDQTTRVLLYRLRRMFHSEQQLHPSRENLTLRASHYLNYVRNAWFWFSLEGGGFFAFDIPRTSFFRGDLPVHLDDQYFLLFVLSLQQRFVLMGLSDEVARCWNPSERKMDPRRQVFRRIRDRLFGFTARGYFCQVMQRENHHRCYRRWQKTFQIAKLYEEVRNEVQEMHDHLQDQQRVRRERQVSLLTLLLTVLIGAPSLVMAFLSINLAGVTSKDEGLPVEEALGLVGRYSLVLAAVFSFTWLLVRWTNRQSE